MNLKAIVKPKNLSTLKQQLLSYGIKAEEEGDKLYIDQEIDPYIASEIKKLLDQEESSYEFYSKVIFFQRRLPI